MVGLAAPQNTPYPFDYGSLLGSSLLVIKPELSGPKWGLGQN